MSWVDSPNEMIDIPCLISELREQFWSKNFISEHNGKIKRKKEEFNLAIDAAIKAYPDMRTRTKPSPNWLNNFFPNSLLKSEEEREIANNSSPFEFKRSREGERFVKKHIDTLCWVLLGESFETWCRKNPNSYLVTSKTLDGRGLVHPLMGIVNNRVWQHHDELFDFIKTKKPKTFFFYGSYCERISRDKKNWIVGQIKRGTNFRFLVRHPDSVNLEFLADFYRTNQAQIEKNYADTFSFFSSTMKSVKEWATKEGIAKEIYQKRFEVKLCKDLTYMTAYFLDMDRSMGIAIIFSAGCPMFHLERESVSTLFAPFSIGINGKDTYASLHHEVGEVQWGDEENTKRIDQVVNSPDFSFENIQGINREMYSTFCKFYE